MNRKHSRKHPDHLKFRAPFLVCENCDAQISYANRDMGELDDWIDQHRRCDPQREMFRHPAIGTSNADNTDDRKE